MTQILHGTVTVHLPAQQILFVVPSLGAGRTVELVADRPGTVTAVPAGETTTFGPYATPKRYRIEALDGSLDYTIAEVDFPTLAEASAAAAAAQFTVVGSIGDVCEITGDGAPASSVQASLSRNPAGDDNALTFTAKTAGVGGDLISVAYVDPGANDAVLSVDVTDYAITVNLATDGGGSITSTAAEVKAAVEAKAEAAALVTVTIDTGDTGVADDGSGVVTALAAANLASGAGVAAGTAGIGSRYTDVTNGALYLNTGTKAVPIWSQLATA